MVWSFRRKVGKWKITLDVAGSDRVGLCETGMMGGGGGEVERQ